MKEINSMYSTYESIECDLCGYWLSYLYIRVKCVVLSYIIEDSKILDDLSVFLHYVF